MGDSTIIGEAGQESSGWSRFWGGAKAAGGALESAAGLATAGFTGWTGAGAVAGGAVALHGADTMLAGLQQVVSGEETPTRLSEGIAALSGSETAGELIDAGIGVLGTAGVGAFARVTAGEPLVAKTVTWTRSLAAGEGGTGVYGDMILSKLGSALDRAQVYLHEKVHSFLSPAADSWFPAIRADIRSFLYSRSSLMRYAEEALAESSAQLGTRIDTGKSVTEALREGLEFPLVNEYVTGKPVAAEAAGAAGRIIDTQVRAYDAARGD